LEDENENTQCSGLEDEPLPWIQLLEPFQELHGFSVLLKQDKVNDKHEHWDQGHVED